MQYAGRRVAVAAVFSIVSSTVSGHAATVSQQAGAVLVNKGSGFSQITSDVELPPGAQVMVQQGGIASITYAGGCAVRVGSGIWTVQPAPPCANGSSVLDFTGRMNQQTPPTSTDGLPLMASSLIVAGGFVVLGTQGSDKPASP
jgi:hypothetical protein